MKTFNAHCRMSPADASDYAALKMPGFFGPGPLESTEIGDGNINYVFRVRHPASGKSLIIKQADYGTRSGGTQLGLDRMRIEAEILQQAGRLAPGMVPVVYLYDPVMSCTIMEDLGDHRILRQELMQYRIFPQLAQDISSFIVQTLVPTMDFVLPAAEKKAAVKKYTNPNLCSITERLVYTYPFSPDGPENEVIPTNAAFVAREIYGDAALKLEAAKLKYHFMNCPQALLHGDLHSGSIFVQEASTKVIDPEFAFYGPIGYDLGNFIGNLCFAWARAQYALHEPHIKAAFVTWIEGCLKQTLALFSQKFQVAWLAQATDPLAKNAAYAQWLLSTILEDSAGVAGLEIIRRIVGMAKVADLTTMAVETERAAAERLLLRAAKQFMLQRSAYQNGQAYLDTLKSQG